MAQTRHARGPGRRFTSGDPAANPHRFQKGQSGNPGGRAKGLERLVREKTREGLDVVNFVLRVFQGKAIGAPREVVTKSGEVVSVPNVPTLELRMEAASWLADRGFGKPAQVVIQPDQPKWFVVGLRKLPWEKGGGGALPAGHAALPPPPAVPEGESPLPEGPRRRPAPPPRVEPSGGMGIVIEPVDEHAP